MMRDFIFLAKIVKLTNSLVEPRTHKFWHSLFIAAPSDKKTFKFYKLWIIEKIIFLLCYKYVLTLVPIEIVSDQIIAEIDSH
jgi:hypothetical protein